MDSLKYCCEICDYSTLIKHNYNLHLTTRKHKNAVNPKNPNKNVYNCVLCSYETTRLDTYKRHIESLKHKKNAVKTINVVGIKEQDSFQCNCGKKYKHQSSLSYHKKKCNVAQIVKPLPCEEETPSEPTNEFIANMLVQQHEEHKRRDEEHKKRDEENNKIIKDLTEKVSTMSLVTNNTQNFNLQFFLNEQCKDAIDLKTFLDQIIITLEDIMVFANSTYNNGMKSIIDRTFGAIDIYKRPLHCTDLKRNVFLSKLENGSWDKNKGNEQIKYVIKEISNKTTDYIHKKCSEYVHDVDSEEFNWYIGLAKIVMAIDESLGCYTNTIMKYISEKVHLDKKMLSGREAPV
jgi:hypothetical protein